MQGESQKRFKPEADQTETIVQRYFTFVQFYMYYLLFEHVNLTHKIKYGGMESTPSQSESISEKIHIGKHKPPHNVLWLKTQSSGLSITSSQTERIQSYWNQNTFKWRMQTNQSGPRRPSPAVHSLNASELLQAMRAERQAAGFFQKCAKLHF